MMLTSTATEHSRQQRLTALAVHEAERLAPRGALIVAAAVQTYQAAAIEQSLSSLDAILAEQGIDAASDAAAVPLAFLTAARPLAEMLGHTDTLAALVRLVQTLVRDAARTARAADMATRPAVTGYVRSLRLPSCGRCVVLAGRVYRYSRGFLRHPECDCEMTPTTQHLGPELVTDPAQALRRGQVTGLSAGDIAAIDAGADLGRVVNTRRRAAGLTVGSSVIARAGRLTPQGCIQLASDRAELLELLRRHGYITT